MSLAALHMDMPTVPLTPMFPFLGLLSCVYLHYCLQCECLDDSCDTLFLSPVWFFTFSPT